MVHINLSGKKKKKKYLTGIFSSKHIPHNTRAGIVHTHLNSYTCNLHTGLSMRLESMEELAREEHTPLYIYLVKPKTFMGLTAESLV